MVIMIIPLIATFVAGQLSFNRIPLSDSSAFSDLATYWREQMSTFGVTSYSIAIIKDGKVAVLDAVGESEPNSGKKANIDTRYYIASITKTMTATAIAQLAERGKLDLDAPVQKYLPRFTLADADFAKKVTVRDLLCHRPGITGGEVVTLDAYTGGITDDRFYKIVGASTPKKQIQYTNVHFTILGRVIQAVTGKPWQTYLRENVFLPAGMNRSTALVSDCHDDPNFAPPHVIQAGKIVPAPTIKTDRTMHAAGGVMTTASDMAKYMTMVMSKGSINGTKILSAETVGQMLSLQSQPKPQGSIRKIQGFGYAWNLGSYRNTPGFVMHGGGYTGYSAFVCMVPEKGCGVAILTNSGAPADGFNTVVSVDVMDRLLGYPLDERLRKSYLDETIRLVAEQSKHKPIAPNPAVSGQLSLDARKYAGTFHNDLYGDIMIRLSGGNLAFDWDDLPQLLKSKGLDAFSAHTDADDSGTSCRFVVENGGVKGIEVKMPNEVLRFNRRR